MAQENASQNKNNQTKKWLEEFIESTSNNEVYKYTKGLERKERQTSKKIRINKKNISNMDKSIPQYWDDQIPGFGIRNNKTTSVYMYMYRNKVGQAHKVTIGSLNVLSPEQAREKALKYAVMVANQEDPSEDKKKLKQTSTIAEVCDIYIKEGCNHKRESTIKGDIGRIETIIKPLVGNKPIISFTYADSEKMLNDIITGNKIAHRIKLNKPRAVSHVRGGSGVASRTMQLFSAIMNFAVRRGLIDKNPTTGLKKPKGNPRELYLSEEEIIRLGEVMSLERNIALYSQDINAIKLLLLTGCRKGEILSLKWNYVNFEEHCFDFPTTKTGKQKRVFGKAAENLLLMLKQTKLNDSEYVFPGSISGTYRSDVLDRLKEFLQYKDEAGNQYVTNKNICVHSLRHTYGTMAGSLKYSEITIAGLLGHKVRGVTGRYVHNIDKNLIEAATEVSGKIYNLLQGIR